MKTDALPTQIGSVTGFFRSALSQLSRPALWKRRRDLRICETLSLGNRNFVAVVGYQEQRFLIAGTSTSIALLADVTNDGDLENDDGGEPGAGV